MWNILLAEDDEAFRCLMARVLAGQGYNVIEAGDGMEALDAAKAHRGPIHLLCAGAAVTRMDALALAEKLKPAHPQLKVLITVPAKHLMKVGKRPVSEVHPEYAVLQRPFSLEQLTAKVRTMLAAPQGQAVAPA
ncbi:MAG TPA: response regulator [Bryobacteraceae bacterium]|nr:response regulator [Bryobacteraceae bacterium]